MLQCSISGQSQQGGAALIMDAGQEGVGPRPGQNDSGLFLTAAFEARLSAEIITLTSGHKSLQVLMSYFRPVDRHSLTAAIGLVDKQLK
jgi:hypothetical protein